MSSEVTNSPNEQDVSQEVSDTGGVAFDPSTTPTVETLIVAEEKPSSPTVQFTDDEQVPSVPVCTKPELQYSREILLNLQCHPLSKIKPPYFEVLQAKSILSKLDQYFSKELDNERKRSESVTEDDKNGANETTKRRQLKKRNTQQEKEELIKKHQSPHDRLRKEDEIVLSPQRRSFNSGCFVSATLQSRGFSNEPRRHRLDSLPSSKDGRDTDIPGDHRKQRLESLTVNKDSRDSNPMNREVGSRRLNRGRLMSRESVWDFRENESSIDHFRTRDERYDKRMFDRRNDSDKDKFQDKDNSNKYTFFGSDRRRTLGEERVHMKQEKEPEWFSGGPKSQYDVIDLRGFDDPLEDRNNKSKRQNLQSRKKNSMEEKTINNASKKQNKPLELSNFDASGDVENMFTTGSEQNEKSASPDFRPTSVDLSKDIEFLNVKSAEEKTKEDISSFFSSENLSSPKKSEFSLDDFLKFDSLPSLLADSGGDDEEGGGSKFRRWFKTETVDDVSSTDSLGVFNNSASFNSMINDLTGMTDKEMDTDKFFTPISPTATHKGPSIKIQPELKPLRHDKNDNEREPLAQKSLLELLQAGTNNQVQRDCVTPGIQELERSGKIHSVEELEAHLRKPKNEKNKDEDITAFKKLLGQVVGSSNSPFNASTGAINSPYSQASNLYDMIHKSSTQQPTSDVRSDLKIEPTILFSGIQQQNYTPYNVTEQGQERQMHLPPQDQLKQLYLQQLQREQQQKQQMAKLMNPAARLPATTGQFNNVPTYFSSLSPDAQSNIRNAQLSNELLQRPEAQALLVGLKRGQISLYNLVEQLKSNFAIQPRYREILASVIKFWIQQTNEGDNYSQASQRNVAPPPQPFNMLTPPNADQYMHQIFMSQQQPQQEGQLNIPTPHSNYFQRIPSPQELQVHTQNIMQSALIKKKLEEQRENFIKRQEMQRSQSPDVNSSVNTSTSPLLSTFTPTSVLRQKRKPTDKDPMTTTENPSKSTISENQMPTGSGLVNIHGQNPRESSMTNRSWEAMKTSKGRPIVKKSSDNYGYQQQGMMPGMEFTNNFANPNQWNRMMAEQVQFQQNMPNMPHPGMMGFNQNLATRPPNPMQQAQLSAPNRSVSTSNLQNLFFNPNYSSNNDLQRSSTMQDVPRLPAQMITGSRPYSGPEASFGRQKVQVGSKQEPSAASVNDQLARWFSPELLAQARAGKLPDMVQPQKMLSVEELERFQQAVPD